MADLFAEACPSRHLLTLIADKWSLLIMFALKDKPRRNNELLRQIEGISQKMLTQTLRSLEGYGLVKRQAFQVVPPHVEYELTPLGQSLGKALKSLDQWLVENTDQVMIARAELVDEAHVPLELKH
ncbi:MAG: helix-turn-helix transcriptional regulator [Stenomitos rutilans HA7619-LM2]|nr:helix-turn-helix transcriptional regulator [Stenomitos rutilans HA7619-LM2]